MKLCFDANGYLHQATGIEKRAGFAVCPKALMKDGFSISIQASEFHYCSPRNSIGPWNEMELGFPSELDPILDEYAEEPDTSDTVFGYVPIAIVNELISKHGGIIIED